MKLFRGCCRIAGAELRTQWHFFIVFLVSASVFFSTLISILMITQRIPSVIDKNFSRSPVNYITLNRIPEGYLPFLESLPVEIIVFPKLNGQMIGNEDLSGRTGNYLNDRPNASISLMNDAVIEGTTWTESDNSSYKIWLSTELAEKKRLNIGDEMHITGRMNTDINAVVAGIFNSEQLGYPDFYVTYPVYEAALPNTVKDHKVTILPNSIFQHNKIINELKTRFIHSSSPNQSVIDGYMAVLFLLYALCGVIGLMVIGVLFATARAYFIRRTRFFSVMLSLGLKKRGIMTVVCLVTQGVLIVAFLVSQFVSPYLLAYVSDCLSELWLDLDISTNVWNLSALLCFLAVSLFAWTICFLGKRKFKTSGITELVRSGAQ